MNSPRENKRWPLASAIVITALAAAFLTIKFSPKETSAGPLESPEQTAQTTPRTSDANQKFVNLIQALTVIAQVNDFQSKINAILIASDKPLQTWEDYYDSGNVPDNSVAGCYGSNFSFVDFGDPETSDIKPPIWVGMDYIGATHRMNGNLPHFAMNVHHPDGHQFFLEATADPESFCEGDDSLTPYIVRVSSVSRDKEAVKMDDTEVICAESSEDLQDILGITPVLERARGLCGNVMPHAFGF